MKEQHRARSSSWIFFFFFFLDLICFDEAVRTVFDSGVNWSQPVIQHDVTRSSLCVCVDVNRDEEAARVGVNDFIRRSLCSERKTTGGRRTKRSRMYVSSYGC